MFRYQDTGNLAEEGEKQVRVPTKTRRRFYKNFIYKKNNGKRQIVSEDSRELIFKLENEGYKRVKTIESSGWEIVEELVIDPNGPNKGLING